MNKLLMLVKKIAVNKYFLKFLIYYFVICRITYVHVYLILYNIHLRTESLCTLSLQCIIL